MEPTARFEFDYTKSGKPLRRRRHSGNVAQFPIMLFRFWANVEKRLARAQACRDIQTASSRPELNAMDQGMTQADSSAYECADQMLLEHALLIVTL
ncbi:hypothetical protein BC936DRAFT_144671 [Jimgerdemannia flammicorona]|uniref:Uncharacterized protein n=2 Tax=Jimgerdemannia flammicorona TaxID=994334 RepID=A0A433DC06_9FUNG|nr:hypothetical protein BC936DRAFT_144671 [Jimgerdemannia flammicorona]RUS31250.1 hypothetical protein BC938DRAFT_478186 [Jimgerdemannia flammicorona]